MKQDILVHELQLLLPQTWERVWMMVVDYRQECLQRLLGTALEILARDEAAVDQLRVDVAAQTVTWRGVTARLTRTEHRIVARLAEEKGEWLPKRELIHHVWGDDDMSGTDGEMLRAHVKNARQRLQSQGISDPILQVRRGFLRLALPPENIAWPLPVEEALLRDPKAIVTPTFRYESRAG